VPADAKVYVTAYGGSLWFYNRDGQLFAAGGGIGAPQVVGEAADADYIEMFNHRGDVQARLVTRDLAGEHTVRVYDLDHRIGQPWVIENARDLGPSGSPSGSRSGGPVKVMKDDARILTVAWPEATDDNVGGGTLVWQDDRYRSDYLSRPTLVPGSRRPFGADVEVSPNGTISAASVANVAEPSHINVRHLPAGKTTWTKPTRISAPKPARCTASTIARCLPVFDLGVPRGSNDMTVAVNDRAGVVALTYNAPAPTTKVTRPARATVRTGKYRVGWNTTWAYAAQFKVQYRIDKGRSVGPWKPFRTTSARGGVLRQPAPAGQTRCYRAKASLVRGGWTAWSTQRCFTYRR
jgi:hypothetical protein